VLFSTLKRSDWTGAAKIIGNQLLLEAGAVRKVPEVGKKSAQRSKHWKKKGAVGKTLCYKLPQGVLK